jgi:hypothetical protein
MAPSAAAGRSRPRRPLPRPRSHLTLSRKPRVRGRPPQFVSAGQQAHETTTNDGQRPRTDRNGGQNGGKKRGHRLRWPHVVTEPKTAKSKRFVPISEPAERLLRAQREAQDEEQRHAGSAWRQTGFVFTTEFGEPCDPRNAFRALRVAATKAGLPHAGLHTLRHSAASVMLTRGVRSRWSRKSSATPRSPSPGTSTATSPPTSPTRPCRRSEKPSTGSRRATAPAAVVALRHRRTGREDQCTS